MCKKMLFIVLMLICIAGYSPCGSAEQIYPAPPVTPPANTHPRVLFTSDRIENIRASVTHSDNKYNYQKYLEYLDKDITGKLSNGKPEYAISETILCNAFEGVINNSEKCGEKAIRMLKNSINTVEYSKITSYDDKSELGWLVTVAACVYDWNYNLLSENDKDVLRGFMLEASAEQEVGYPPTGKSMVFTHGSEYQINRDMLAAAIAIYDEYPDMYDVVAGRIFADSVDARKFLNQSKTAFQGSKYIWRMKAEMYAVWLMDAIGYPNLYGDGYSEIMRTALYTRRPDGMPLADGDFSFNNKSADAKIYNDAEVMTLVYGYYKDPFLKQMVRGFFNYSMKSPVEQFIFNDCSLKKESYESLPLSKYLPYPKGEMICRTGWDMDSGKDSEDVIVQMKINEYNFAEHQHYDSGAFQIYYKGYLATDSGYYQASNQNLVDRQANDGSTHCDSNYTNQYTRRSIAHNTMLVYDPDEVFYDTAKLYKLENDGGQKAPSLWTANAGHRLDYFLNDANGYHTGRILGHEIQGDSDTPDYTYLKGDLTNAYSSKVSEFERSFMFLNLKDDEHPAALIVFDNVVSSNANFKKTFLCHGLFEPEINGKRSVFADTRDGYSGRLTVDTLLPKQENLEINSVGGYDTDTRAGAKVGDNIYYADIDKDGRQEGGGWRLEISPKTACEQDYFLNVFQVGDNETSAPLDVELIEGVNVTGVQLADRVVVFGNSKTTAERAEFSFESADTMKISVADLSEGNYIVLKDNEYYCTQTVGKGCSVAYFSGSGGSYALARTADSDNGKMCFYTEDMSSVQETISRYLRVINTGKTENSMMFVAYYDSEERLIGVREIKNGERVDISSVGTDKYIVGDYFNAEKHSWGGVKNACYAYNSRGAFYDIDTETGLNNRASSVRWNNLNKTTSVGDEKKVRTALFAHTLTDGEMSSFQLSEYKYVNAWVYSHKATDQKLRMRIYYKGSLSEYKNPQGKSDGYHYLYSAPITVNWVGWKLVTIKIDDMTDNMKQYGGAYSWNDKDMQVKSTGFQANSALECDMIDISIDSIWYSKNKPDEYDSKISQLKAFCIDNKLSPLCKNAVLNVK